MRVERHFAFLDLGGFTTFTSEQGDEEAVRVLGGFRAAVRAVASHHAVRIAKWLGDGCMLVAVDAGELVAAVCDVRRSLDAHGLPLPVHAGLAGGRVLMLEGDDYIGNAVNLAARLCEDAQDHEVLATPGLAALAPSSVAVGPPMPRYLAGMAVPVDVVRIGLPPAMPSVLPSPGDALEDAAPAAGYPPSP